MPSTLGGSAASSRMPFSSFMHFGQMSTSAILVSEALPQKSHTVTVIRYIVAR